MIEISSAWALYSLAFTLGLRHGFDADHLAAVDGIARRNVVDRPRLARLSGLLFSVGHGSVVIVAAVVICLFAVHWQPPAWLETGGGIIAVILLFSLAALNIRALSAAPSTAVVAPKGIRGPFINRLFKAGHPAVIIGIGVLFAIAIDTFLQAALFAGFAVQFGGSMYALYAALAFTAGMILTDGINGYLIASMIGQVNRRAAIASRIMTMTVIVLSLLLGTAVVVGLVSSTAGDWMDENALWFSIAVVGATGLVYLVTIAAVRQERTLRPL